LLVIKHEKPLKEKRRYWLSRKGSVFASMALAMSGAALAGTSRA
jgi:hypothetical protein